MVVHKGDPVCTEAKVFVGQVPLEATQEQVQHLFSKYGTIKNCVIISHQDGRSKGAAMVLYERYGAAELAVEGEDNKNNLGGTKPMVVRIADPPRRGDGPVMGIAPKKLFVGQIPITMTEAELRNMFSPYGNIVDLALLKKNAGAACAFITYERWAQCEDAIEAHSGKTHLEGAKMPMVVKFADAKVDPNAPMGMMNMGAMSMPMGMGMVGMDMNSMGMKRPFEAGASHSNKKQFNNMAGGFNTYGMPGFDMNMLQAQMGYSMPGMGMPMGGMMGMQGGMPNMPGMVPGMASGMGGMGSMGGMGGMGGPRSNGGQLMQSNRLGPGVASETAKQWKLFVGQVPFEATETDLWPIFAEVGTILELVVLRNPLGRSRGCAFVTFESRDLAEKAIASIDQQVYLPNDPKQRVLLVKFANPGMSSGGGGGGQAAASHRAGMPPPNGGGMNGAGAHMMAAGPGMGAGPGMAAAPAMGGAPGMAGTPGSMGMAPMGAAGMVGQMPGQMPMSAGMARPPMAGMGTDAAAMMNMSNVMAGGMSGMPGTMPTMPMAQGGMGMAEHAQAQLGQQQQQQQPHSMYAQQQPGYPQAAPNRFNPMGQGF